MTQKNSVWKRSSKDSPTWTRLDGNYEHLGELWYGLSMVRNDETGALAIFRKEPLAQSVISAYTLGEGEAWQPIERMLIKGNSFGWSCGVVDWNSEPMRMLARIPTMTNQDDLTRLLPSNWKPQSNSARNP